MSEQERSRRQRSERKKKQKQKETGMVLQALTMVFQFGLNMIVPILMCTFLGIWLGKVTGISWLCIPLIFLGALAGANSIYRMAKKLIDSDRREK